MFRASTSTAILNSVPPIAEDDAAQHMLRVRQILNAILPSIYRFEFSTDGLRKWLEQRRSPMALSTAYFRENEIHFLRALNSPIASLTLSHSRRVCSTSFNSC